MTEVYSGKAKSAFYGAGAPAVTLGEVYERYLDEATGNEYYKNTSGWVRVTNLGSVYKTSAGVYYSICNRTIP